MRVRRRFPTLSENLLNELRLFRDGKIPQGYNETIKWLMVNGQMAEQVICSDKFLCRGYVSDRVGSSYLRKVYQSERSIDNIATNHLPKNFVVKTNHDSGSVYFVSDKQRQWSQIKRKVRKKLRRVYGIDKGEWAYAYIHPLVFTEEYMEGPVTDYKFHVCNGQICWVQIIWNRSRNHAQEANVDMDYKSLGMHFDQNFIFNDVPPSKPKCWREMLEISEVLGHGFKYVRIDLYELRGKPSFGEMTFWPLAGDYQTVYEPNFGELLNVDLSTRKHMIHDFFNSI